MPKHGETEPTLARPPVVSQNEWDAARTTLLEREQTVAAAMHELAAARKRMPMVRVEHDYVFEGPDGPRSLPELFDGRSQLILYRFFFEEGVAGGPTPGALAVRPSPTASPSSASCMLATSLRDGIVGTSGEPPPLRRAHGLDGRALVHDPQRALLG